ncbi:hypothetical protein HOY34_11350 [Xinfangfangia sp. D13-10-4-6]|uniref:hypothetical protein n=1 Tax=Pseudogemmobacter hezensis TaxID=2737662 RepID=UPI0015567C5C|nr:hypothetical protein [Pseudogemmobacter hezensis]NPD15797.1 hypothetical protein [Pseudogemmobacter hezensis]
MIYGYDYRLITETETDPYQPPTTDLFKALAKNWIAGFEGSRDAPRLQPKALASNVLGVIGAAPLNYAGVSGVNGYRIIRMSGVHGGPIFVQFLPTGSDTWSAGEQMFSGSGTISLHDVLLNLVTGAVLGSITSLTIPTGAAQPTFTTSAYSGSVIVPSSIKAVRWRQQATGAGPWSSVVTVLEGRADV